MLGGVTGVVAAVGMLVGVTGEGDGSGAFKQAPPTGRD
jgi:hypothetical protein